MATKRNTAPRITSAVQAARLTEDASLVQATGAITFADADANDNRTVEIRGSGQGKYGKFELGMLKDSSANATGEQPWAYQVDTSAVQFLSKGQSVVETFVVVVTDSAGKVATQSVTITVVGTNDNVVIAKGEATVLEGSLKEDSGKLVSKGAIAFSDLDLNDKHTASFSGKAAYGRFALDKVQAPASKDGVPGMGSVGWSYTADATRLQFLAEGETLIETFTVNITDNQGSTASEVVKITLTGANDEVLITSKAQRGQTTEANAGSRDLIAQGAVTFNDADSNTTMDRHESSFTVKGSTATQGTYGTFMLDPLKEPVGGRGGSQGWRYTADEAKVNFLAKGQSVSETFTVEIKDKFGSSKTQDVTVTVVGTNDAVVLSAESSQLQERSLKEDGLERTVEGQLSFTDADLRDKHTASFSGVARYGKFTLDTNKSTSFDTQVVNGEQQPGVQKWSYTLDTAKAQSLAKGQTYVEKFTVMVSDGQGSVASQQVEVSLVGENDEVRITSLQRAVVARVNNDVGVAATGQVTFSDADLLDTHTTSINAGNKALDGASDEAEGQYGTLRLTPLVDSTNAVGGSQGWEYTLKDGAATALAQGESVSDVFTLTVRDAHGSSKSQLVTLRVLGTNDAPEVDEVKSILEASYTEPVPEVSELKTSTSTSLKGEVVATDVDRGDRLTYKVVGEPVYTYTPAGKNALDAVPDALASQLFKDLFKLDAPQKSGAWTFEVDRVNFDTMAEGDTLQLSYQVAVIDKLGLSDTATVNIVITGTNDAVTLTASDAPEAPAGKALSFDFEDFPSGPLQNRTSQGVAFIGFEGEGHDTPRTPSSDQDGMVFLKLVPEDTFKPKQGTINVKDGFSEAFSFNFGGLLDEGATAVVTVYSGLNGLGESLLESTLTIPAGFANSSPDSLSKRIAFNGTAQSVVFTIKGDAYLHIDDVKFDSVLDPTAEPDAEVPTEALEPGVQQLKAVTGTLKATDIDVGDLLTTSSTFKAVTLNGKAFTLPEAAQSLASNAALVLDPASATSDGSDVSIGYTYAPKADLDFLSRDDELAVTFTVKVSDGASEASHDVTITIKGTNDAVTLADGQGPASAPVTIDFEGFPEGLLKNHTVNGISFDAMRTVDNANTDKDGALFVRLNGGAPLPEAQKSFINVKDGFTGAFSFKYGGAAIASDVAMVQVFSGLNGDGDELTVMSLKELFNNQNFQKPENSDEYLLTVPFKGTARSVVFTVAGSPKVLIDDFKFDAVLTPAFVTEEASEPAGTGVKALTEVTGTLKVNDPDVGDLLTATPALKSVMLNGKAFALPDAAKSVAADTALVLTPASATSDGGDVSFDYRYAPEANLDFLNKDDKLAVTYSVTFSDGLTQITQDVIINIAGTNDAVTLTAGTAPTSKPVKLNFEDFPAPSSQSSPLTNHGVQGLVFDGFTVKGNQDAPPLSFDNDKDGIRYLSVSPSPDSTVSQAQGVINVPDGFTGGFFFRYGGQVDPGATIMVQAFSETGGKGQLVVEGPLSVGSTLQGRSPDTVSSGFFIGEVARSVVFTVKGSAVLNIDDIDFQSVLTPPSVPTEPAEPGLQLLKPVTGALKATDLDVGDTLTASSVFKAVTLNDKAFTLPTSAESLKADAALTLQPASAKSNGGDVSIGYTYAPAKADLDFLRQDDELAVTYTVKVSDGSTDASHDVTITIKGANDAVTLAGGQAQQAATSAPVTVDFEDFPIGALTNHTVKGLSFDGLTVESEVNVGIDIDKDGAKFLNLLAGPPVAPGQPRKGVINVKDGFTDAFSFNFGAARITPIDGAVVEVYSEVGGMGTLLASKSFSSPTISPFQNTDANSLMVSFAGTARSVVIRVTGAPPALRIDDLKFDAVLTPGPVGEIKEATEPLGTGVQTLTAVTGTLKVNDRDMGDLLTATPALKSVMLNGKAYTLPDAAKSVASDTALVITPASTTSNGGDVSFAYNYAPTADLDFLNKDDKLAVTYTVTFSDGPTQVTQDVTINITGTDEAASPEMPPVAGPAALFSPTPSGVGGFSIVGGGKFINQLKPSEYYTIGTAGDFNRDGVDDFLVGVAPSKPGSSTGVVYLVYGQKGLVTNTVDLDKIADDGDLGFLLFSTLDFNGKLGSHVSALGDFNNDGFDDLLVTAPEASFNNSNESLDNPGQAHVIFGRSEPFPSVTNLTGARGDIGALIFGGQFSAVYNQQSPGTDLNRQFVRLGNSAAAVGDVNGDGFDDFAVSDVNNAYAHIVFGRPAATFDKRSLPLDRANTATLSVSGLGAGDLVVSAAGDVNNDEFADILFGRPHSSTLSDAYLFKGNTSLVAPSLGGLLDSGGPNYTAFRDLSTSSNAGAVVSAAGNFNGDQFADFAIASPGIGLQPGEVSVGFGNTSNIFKQNLPFSRLIKNTAPDAPNHLGYSLASVGDTNGDGLDDLLIGTQSETAAIPKVYLIYGTTTLDGVLDLATLTDTQGQAISVGTQVLPAGVGTKVSAVGDVNDDGYSDFSITTTDGSFSAVYFGRSNVPTPPTAVDDYLKGFTSGRQGTVNVLANDTDPNKDVLKVLLDDMHSSQIKTSFGMVVLNEDGTATYTLNENLTFAQINDSFTYTVTDGKGGTDEGMVMVDLSNFLS